MPPAHPVHVARRHHVQRDRDDPDGVLRQGQQIEPLEARRVELRPAQDLRALLQRRDRRLPEPGVFLRRLEPARCLQLVRARRQALRQLQLREEVRQRPRLLRGRPRRAAGPFQAPQRPRRTAAQDIYAFERGLRRLVIFALPALRVHVPVPVREPGSALDVPGDAVVFQLVTFLRVQPGEARAQVGEELRPFPAAQNALVGGGNERGQGFLRDVRLPRREKRHAVVRKGRLQRGAVVLKTADRHGDVAPAAAALGQLHRPRRRQFALRAQGFGAV